MEIRIRMNDRVQSSNVIDESFDWQKKIVTNNSDEPFEIQANTLFRMLQELPDGIKWNPFTERFEKTA